jgi:hypothetical protein
MTKTLEQLRDAAIDAALFADTFDPRDAAPIADLVVDNVIRTLRSEPRMPRLGWQDWELLLGDLRSHLTRELAELIASRDGPVDIAERAIDALIEALAADRQKTGAKNDRAASV